MAANASPSPPWARRRISSDSPTSVSSAVMSGYIRGFQENDCMTRPAIGGISPFFIVGELDAALAFYRDKLGFGVPFRGPEDDPFFGIVKRDQAMIMFKVVGVPPLPNSAREPAARWD